jgi:hypothetical protein
MKTNEIINEGPADWWRREKAGWAARSASKADNKAIDNINANFEKWSKEDITGAAKSWRDYESTIPNRAALHNNPNAYYNELKKFLTKRYSRTPGFVSPETQNPTSVDQSSVQDVINQYSRVYFDKKKKDALASYRPKQTQAVPIGDPSADATQAAPAPGTAPASTSTTPATPNTGTNRQRGPNGRFTSNRPAPEPGTPPASTTTPAAPKAGDPVPGMSGYVYTGKVDARGRPGTKPAPATTAAPADTDATSTLPTKAKSKTKAKDIDIDAALKMADTLSPEEKKKLLQDLLKSGVTVRAGGA